MINLHIMYVVTFNITAAASEVRGQQISSQYHHSDEVQKGWSTDYIMASLVTIHCNSLSAIVREPRFSCRVTQLIALKLLQKFICCYYLPFCVSDKSSVHSTLLAVPVAKVLLINYSTKVMKLKV